MRRFLEAHKLDNIELVPEDRINRIKCSVMTRIGEDDFMKKRRIFRSLVIAAAVAATSVMTAVGAIATVQPQIVEIDGAHYEKVQVNEFDALYRQLDGFEPEPVPDDSELTLISTNEYVDGDYRFVDKLYALNAESLTRSVSGTDSDWRAASHEVYYEPKNSKSVYLGRMYIKAYFTWNEKENSVIADDRTIEYRTTKESSYTYPIVTDYEPESGDNRGGIFGKKYAFVEYSADFEKASGKIDRHTVRLTVDSDGTAHNESSYGT